MRADEEGDRGYTRESTHVLFIGTMFRSETGDEMMHVVVVKR